MGHTLRHTLRSLTLVGATLTCAAVPLAQAATIPVAPPTKVDISIGGIGPGVDAKAFSRVKLLISAAVYDGTVDYFNVDGYGKEGGFSACIEKSPRATASSFTRLVKMLQAIQPDRSTSFYSVTPDVGNCRYPANPDVLPVAQ
jgi:hypothetical protein